VAELSSSKPLNGTVALAAEADLEEAAVGLGARSFHLTVVGEVYRHSFAVVSAKMSVGVCGGGNFVL